MTEEENKALALETKKGVDDIDSDFETESEDEDDELEYHGVLGLFYRAKDWCEDAIERVNESEKVTRVRSSMTTAGKAGWGVTQKGGKVIWVVGTTLLVMVLPLILEVEREQSHIENLQSQEALLRQQGYSQQQLAQMGYGGQRR